MPSSVIVQLWNRFCELRERAGISMEELERRLILGPGWVSQFESGATSPPMDLLFAMLQEIGADPADLFHGINLSGIGAISHKREISAEQDGIDLAIEFRYAKFDATYTLPNATLNEFEQVIQIMRDELARLSGGNDNEAQAIKANSVVKTFLKAVTTWPHANASDLWWFIVYRAYCDRYNHPAKFSRLNLDQSWKRTAGWALEEVMVQYYGPFLERNGVLMYIADSAEKVRLIRSLSVDERLEPDKVDVVLVGVKPDGSRQCFGVVHVKASFAERRTDDVPMSQALVAAGYTSPLWTMDCKSTPSEQPFNHGELGVVLGDGQDQRSAKRKDIEDDGFFSACFSYNTNTVPTPEGQDARAHVRVCNFRNSDDEFSQFILSEWNRHST